MFEDPHLPLGGTAERRWRYWRRYALIVGGLVLAFAIHEASDTYGKAATRAAEHERAAMRRRGGGPPLPPHRPSPRPGRALGGAAPAQGAGPTRDVGRVAGGNRIWAKRADWSARSGSSRAAIPPLRTTHRAHRHQP